jgi:hypothetical protein
MKLLRAWIAALAAIPLAAGAGCSAGSTGEPDDASTAQSGGSAGTADVGGAGGSGATGGGGEFPCGIDCALVETDACHVAVCDPQPGDPQPPACKVIDAPDGTVCDDSQFCTLNDACSGGVCAGPDPNDCGLQTAPCEEVLCHEQTASCELGTLGNGVPCQPLDLCQLGATCQNALCVGFPNECFFAPVPNECHVPVCNPMTGDCDPVPGNEGLPCNDPNDLCTVNKTCAAGVCQGGTAKNCSDLTEGCVLGTCDPTNGQCFAQPLLEGDPCDDLDACTSGESCQMMACTGGVVQTQCMGGDLCCAAGCDETNDSDCILDILLLGDDVTQAGWDAFRTALTAAGESWTEHDLDVLPFPTFQQLGAYNTLVWFDESTLVPGDGPCQIVADWLLSGNKHLLVAGVDFLWDMQNGVNGMGEKNLYDLWGITYAGDFSGTAITTIDGVPGDPIGGSFAAPDNLQLAVNADSSGDWANEMLGPAVHAAHYGPGGNGSGHAALSYYTAGPYELVWLGVNFHNGLPNPAQRDQLMLNIMSYFKN